MTSVLASVRKNNAGRDPRRLALKYEEMAASPFAFLRGSCHLFYERLPLQGTTESAPATWVCGDLHFENFGRYRGSDGIGCFDLNDFDEACLAPCTWDVVRFQTSLLLAARELELGKREADGLTRRFVSFYGAALAAGNPGRITQGKARGAVKRLLTLKGRSTMRFLDARAPRMGGRRAIRTGEDLEGAKALPTSSACARVVRAALRERARVPGPGHGLRPLDVKDRVAGTGSLGLDRYVVLARGGGGRGEYVLLDVKRPPPSSTATRSPCIQPRWLDQAQRVVAIQSRLQSSPARSLSVLDVGGNAHVLRDLVPSEDHIDLAHTDWKKQHLRNVIEDMARLTAWAHLRGAQWRGSAPAGLLRAFGRRKGWRTPLARLAGDAALQAAADFDEFRSAWVAGDLGPAPRDLSVASSQQCGAR